MARKYTIKTGDSLWNSPNDEECARLVDAGGNETAIEFSGVHYNSPVDASHFKFEVPRGVDVIDKRRVSRDG